MTKKFMSPLTLVYHSKKKVSSIKSLESLDKDSEPSSCDLKSTIFKSFEEERLKYYSQLALMNQVELLEELVKFQEKLKSEGDLTPLLIQKGQILFQALEKWIILKEIRDFARTYKKHLEFEWLKFIEA